MKHDDSFFLTPDQLTASRQTLSGLVRGFMVEVFEMIALDITEGHKVEVRSPSGAAFRWDVFFLEAKTRIEAREWCCKLKMTTRADRDCAFVDWSVTAPGETPAPQIFADAIGAYRDLDTSSPMPPDRIRSEGMSQASDLETAIYLAQERPIIFDGEVGTAAETEAFAEVELDNLMIGAGGVEIDPPKYPGRGVDFY